MRQPIDHVLHQIKSVQLILHPNVKGSRDRPLFDVASNMEVPVKPPVGQTVDQRGVSMKSEDGVLIFCEKRIIIPFGESIWVLTLRLQLHQIDDIDLEKSKLDAR